MKKVAVLVEMSTTWGRDLIRGVFRYAEETGPWSFYIEPRGLYELQFLPPKWEGDGVIARVTSRELASQLLDTGLPVVNVSTYDIGIELFHTCTADDRLVGVMAAEHLLARGITTFAYCDDPTRLQYTDLLGVGFCEHIRKAGHIVQRFTAENSEEYTQRRKRMADWLILLPKPLGLLAWSDVQARFVTDVCMEIGINIPRDVAVVGGQFEELLGSISIPPLSSMDIAAQTVGYQAAGLLERLMQGALVSERLLLIKPARCVIRHSTDTVAVNDSNLAVAIKFIHEQFNKDITVDHVVDSAAVSRRRLEQCFRKYIGRGIHEEILMTRLDHVKQLLQETNLPITHIAGKCGFATSDQMTRAFRKHFGLSSSQYRQMFGKY